MEAKHTAGPWRAIEWACHASTTIAVGIEGETIVIAECSGHGRNSDEDVIDAAFIVCACNAHDALVDALQMAKHIVDAEGTREQAQQVFAALEKAGVNP